MERHEDERINGPVGDEEIPVMEHLLELRRRLITVLIPFGIVTLVVFPFSGISLHFLFTNLFSEDISISIFVYSPLEWISVRLLFSFLCALSLILPLLLYEIFAFMRPGLYPSERKFFMLVVIPSLCLYGTGALFAYRVALPVVLHYLIGYSGEIAEVALSAKRIFSFILYTAVGFGLIFQIPLILFLAVKLELVSYSWLKEKRLMIYGLVIGIALFVTADPTGISMLMAGVTIAMFESGLLLSRLSFRKKRIYP